MNRRMQAKALEAARTLICTLRERGEQSMVDLAVSLEYSASGTRKHVTRLEQAGIVSRRIEKILGENAGLKMMVKLCASDEAIAEHLVAMELSAAPKKAAKVKVANFEIGTMVHEMMDDLGTRIRKNTKIKVQRHWMDEALFGPAPKATGGAA